MKKYIIIMLCLLWGSSCPIKAQNEVIYFNKTLNIDNSIGTCGNGVALSDGYLFTCNHTLYTDSGYLKGFSIVKTNNKGDIQSIGDVQNIQELYNIQGIAYIATGGDIASTMDGKYVLIGTVQPIGTDNQDLVFIKYDANGVVWQNTLSKPTTIEQCFHVIETSDGGFLVAGRQREIGETSHFFLLKTDAWGYELWSKRYHPNQHGGAFSVAETATGYVASGVIYYSNTSYDMYAVAVDKTNGEVLWENHYGGDGPDIAAMLLPKGVDSCYIAAAIDIEGIRYPFVGVIDGTGELLWSKTIDVPVISIQEAPLQPTSDGGFVCLYSHRTEDGGSTPQFWRFTAQGDTLWTRTIPGSNPYHLTYLKDIAPTPDGGWLLSGFDYSEQSSWVVKVDSLGQTCSYVGCDSLVVAPHGVGVDPSPPKVESGKLMLSPNPASSEVRVAWVGGGSHVAVYDILGNRRLSAEAKGNAATLPVENLPNGIYFCRLEANGRAVASTKFIVFR